MCGLTLRPAIAFLSLQLRSTKVIRWLYPGGKACVTGGHMTSRNQGLSPNDKGRQWRESLGTRLRKLYERFQLDIIVRAKKEARYQFLLRKKKLYRDRWRLFTKFTRKKPVLLGFLQIVSKIPDYKFHYDWQFIIQFAQEPQVYRKIWQWRIATFPFWFFGWKMWTFIKKSELLSD